MAARSGNKISLFEKHFGWCPGSARPRLRLGIGCSYGCGCIKCQPGAKGADVWLFVLAQCLLLSVYRSTNSNNYSSKGRGGGKGRGSNKILMLQLQRNATRTLKVSVTFYATLQLLRIPCAFSCPSSFCCYCKCKGVWALWACTLWQSVAVSLINWAARRSDWLSGQWKHNLQVKWV